MIFKITNARPIKEMVIRFSVALLEINGNLEITHSEYDLAVDVQPYVNVDPAETNKVNINGDALMQEIVNSVSAMQYTATVASVMKNRIWTVLSEEEKNATQALPDQPESNN